MTRRDLDAELDVGRLAPIKRRERNFEYALRDELGRRGIMFVKLKPTIEGFPDRLVLAAKNRMLLVECKRDNTEMLSETQGLMHDSLKAMGIDVTVVYGPNVQWAASIIELTLDAMR